MKAVLYRHKLALPTPQAGNRLPEHCSLVTDSNCKRQKLRAIVESRAQLLIVEHLSSLGASQTEIFSNLIRILRKRITVKILSPTTITLNSKSIAARLLLRAHETEKELLRRKKNISDFVSSLVTGQELGRPAKIKEFLSRIYEMRATGASHRKIAKTLGVSAASVCRILSAKAGIE